MAEVEQKIVAKKKKIDHPLLFFDTHMYMYR